VGNIEGGDGVVGYHRRICERPPWVRWYIQCYHYETRTHTTTDSKGHTSTHTTQDRVNTHSASCNYQLAGFIDSSKPLAPTGHGMAKVHFKKHFSWRDAAARVKHDGEKAVWVRFHDRDTYKDVTWKWGINGYQKHMVELREGEEEPCWFGTWWLVLRAPHSHNLCQRPTRSSCQRYTHSSGQCQTYISRQCHGQVINQRHTNVSCQSHTFTRNYRHLRECVTA
jgi:hypothetical protein